jgi:hypothetical protein
MPRLLPCAAKHRVKDPSASWTGIRRGENSISLQIPMG